MRAPGLPVSTALRPAPLQPLVRQPLVRQVLVLAALLVALLGSLLVAAPAADAAVPGARVVAEASKHRGKPYVYGATGPSRFDCSGFTRYVYSRLGKALPRTSTAQYRATRRIAKSGKQAGDLIFTRSRGGRIGHVGIYAGGGRFWVAPKAGDVVKLQRIYTSNYTVGRV